MPTLSADRAFATPRRRLITCAALLAVGALIGGLLTWQSRDPHTATSERLTGTVPWSNMETRLIAFEQDGEPLDPEGDQTFYNVIGDGMNFPGCLIGKDGDPVREDRRRVEVEAVHQDYGGQQLTHFAVSVRCLG